MKKYMVFWIEDKITDEGLVGLIRVSYFRHQVRASRFARIKDSEVLPVWYRGF